ncbi:MAG: hypothetical protein AAFN10_19880, partial [Bacteroidota bacterium]
SYDELEAVPAYLKERKLDNFPIFRNPSFDDQVLLYPFLDFMTKIRGKLQTEATDFGLEMASTVQEFIHHYQFYIEIAKNHIPQNTASALRIKKVLALYQLLEPLANYLIDVPNVGSEVPNSTLQERLPNFIKTVLFIGYGTKSAALLNIVQNIILKDMDEEQIKDQLELFLKAAKEQAAENKFPPPLVSQNGRIRIFEIPHKKGLTKLMVDHVGNLSLLPGTLVNH